MSRTPVRIILEQKNLLPAIVGGEEVFRFWGRGISPCSAHPASYDPARACGTDPPAWDSWETSRAGRAFPDGRFRESPRRPKRRRSRSEAGDQPAMEQNRRHRADNAADGEQHDAFFPAQMVLPLDHDGVPDPDHEKGDGADQDSLYGFHVFPFPSRIRCFFSKSALRWGQSDGFSP